MHSAGGATEYSQTEPSGFGSAVHGGPPGRAESSKVILPQGSFARRRDSMPNEPASWNVFLNEKFQLLRPAGLPSFQAAGPCCSPEPKHRHANLEPQGQG